MKSTLTAILFYGIFLPAGTISMLGISIGDGKAAGDKLKLQVVASDDHMVKYRTQNGNDFSITTEKGRVVYLENDWLQDPKGRQPLCSDFQFGLTSLADIRNKFGTNGFTYRNRSSFTTETDLITFNSFVVDGPGGEVVVFITKVPLSANPTEGNIAAMLRLDAIIIADASYLDGIWGAKKQYDTNYRKIKL